MSKQPYLHILERKEGKEFSSFYLYLPADEEKYYVQYRFCYEVNPADYALEYDKAPNNPANRKFYRINKAYVVKKEGEEFTPVFRALQGGEIGLAIREEGAGDFVGGVHGDEVLIDVNLEVDGREMSLDKPFFGTFQSLRFYEQSYMFRCNTPDQKIILHTQTYTVDGDTLRLKQDIEWIADAKTIQSAYSPMLTAQRLNPDRFEEILSDTVEFYAPDGRLITTYDTTSYGAECEGKSWDHVCMGTRATSVKVYGKNSGFLAEAGYTVRDGSIPDEQINTSLCIRYMKGAVDNKIYFDIGEGTAPKKGSAWRSDIYYRITYHPEKNEEE